MSTIACVMVYSREPFFRLGGMPVLRRCLGQLEEVRGLDDVFCCTQKELVPEVKSLFPVCAIRDRPGSATHNGDPGVMAWACKLPELAAATMIMIIAPVYPFLNSAKIEACLLAARQHGAAFLGRHCATGHHRGGCIDYSPVTTILPSLYVFQRSVMSDPNWRSKAAAVAVGSIEALNVSDPDDRRMAEALALYGT